MRVEESVRAENRSIVLDGVGIVAPEELERTGIVRRFTPERTLILTGVSQGPVNVAVEALESAPADASGDWEDVVEFDGEVFVGDPVTVHGAFDFPPASFPDLGEHAMQYVRIRVSARGRDIAPDLVATGSEEHYLVQTWPIDEPVGRLDAAESSTVSASFRASA